MESRRRILDAAAEIAGERGYEGTSIATLSAKCGLPVSSIYWTFMAANVAKSLIDVPDFLRLGLMLALERRPVEPCGRTVFLQVRDVARQRIASVISSLFPDLDEDAVHTLTAYAVAGADGLL
ncbi:hypothetical protein SUDANB1_03789 [Streptomyces sp. enrichment culture]